MPRTDIRFYAARWMEDGEGTWLCLRTPSARSVCEGIEAGKPYDAAIKPHRDKRSLDANAYAWVLMGRLSEALRVPPDAVYKNLIKDVGGNYEVFCAQDKAVEKFCSAWESNGCGWLTDTMPSRIEGCTNIRLFYGSSTYDTAQMSRLIDLIVEECRAQGIETMTPEELSGLEGYRDEQHIAN